MQEGYQFAESLSMLLPYYTKNAVKWQRVMNQTIEEGYGAAEILKKFHLDNDFLLAVSLAEKNGRLADTLAFIGKQMKYREELKKNFIKVMIYPLFMFCLLIFFFIAFRVIFLPNMSNLMLSKSYDDLSVIRFSKLLLHMPDYFILIFLLIILSIILFIVSLKRKSIKQRLLIFMKIPFVNVMVKLNLTRLLARNLGSLLVTGYSLQAALEQLKTQNFNSQLQFIANEIEEKIIHGFAFSEVVQTMPFFFNRFDVFIEHGEKGGYLGKELLLYCEMLDEKVNQIVSSIVQLVQPISFIIIAICIIAAYLSILLPMYKMIEIV